MYQVTEVSTQKCMRLLKVSTMPEVRLRTGLTLYQFSREFEYSVGSENNPNMSFRTQLSLRQAPA